MKQFQSFLFFIGIIFSPLQTFSQTKFANASEIDQKLLNEFILKEVNKLRKKADAEPLENRDELIAPAEDHVNYMFNKSKLTHTQRFQKKKKTPKNRVDFYSLQFATVGENVQFNNLNYGADEKDKKNPPITSYEMLAEKLVTAWKNSPGHYANMIAKDFKSTYVAIKVTEAGGVYACQLFGGSVYFDKHKAENDTVKYKPQVEKKCRACEKRPPAGWITVDKDSSIYFEYYLPKPTFHFKKSRMRFYNPWRDGLAADIVLKSQYPCDSASYFNGRRGVRGIPLAPVYKKDFGWIGLMNTKIYLGKVPSYVNEEFEVNLTVINKKRTCTNTLYYVIPTSFFQPIPLEFKFNENELTGEKKDSNVYTHKVIFEKSKTELPAEMLNSIDALVKSATSTIYKVEIKGYASIEGSSTNNLYLFQERTSYIAKQLITLGVDSSKMEGKSEENFADFRSDIYDTKYQKWLNLNDENLKKKVNVKAVSDSLEYILKNHRYVLVHIYTCKKETFVLGKDTVQELLEKSITRKKQKETLSLLSAQYTFVKNKQMTLEELNATVFPNEKEFVGAKYQLAAMNYYLDSLQPNRDSILRAKLDSLLRLESSNKLINTAIAILDYYDFNSYLFKSHQEFIEDIADRKFLDETVRARIILNIAYRSDAMRFSFNNNRLLFDNVKKYVAPAKLDVDKTFEVASYYSYFHDYSFTFNLIKGKVDETQNSDNLVFFLKLVHLSDLKFPRAEYLNYFKKVRKYSGEKFCSYFNNPDLNFQILNDPEIKKIYCEQCGDLPN